jgi:hypothetical protein
MKGEDAFASSITRDPNERNFTIKPSLQPSLEPFVLHHHCELRTLTTMLCMKIQTTVLQHQLNLVNIYLPRLIVKFVPLREAFSGWDTPEA